MKELMIENAKQNVILLEEKRNAILRRIDDIIAGEYITTYETIDCLQMTNEIEKLEEELDRVDSINDRCFDLYTRLTGEEELDTGEEEMSIERINELLVVAETNLLELNKIRDILDERIVFFLAGRVISNHIANNVEYIAEQVEAIEEELLYVNTMRERTMDLIDRYTRPEEI